MGITARSVGHLTSSWARAVIAAIGAAAVVVPLEGLTLLFYVPAAGCPT